MFKFRRRSVAEIGSGSVREEEKLPRTLSATIIHAGSPAAQNPVNPPPLTTLEPPTLSTPIHSPIEPELQREMERNFDYFNVSKKKKKKSTLKVNEDLPTLSPLPPHVLNDSIDLPPSPPITMEVIEPVSFQDFGSKREMKGLKKKLKELEIGFFEAKGYKPSYSDKVKDKEMRKCLVALAKLKKGESSKASKLVANPLNSLTRTVSEILSNLETHGNPKTSEELADEKCFMQKQLLLLEKKHGRAVLKEEKEIVRPLYERYRLLKQASKELVVIVEDEVYEHRERDQVVVENAVLEEEEEDKEDEEESFNELDLPSLLQKLNQETLEKSRLRSILRRFESDFQTLNGRPPLKEEKRRDVAMEMYYDRYKKVKKVVKLLEVLVAKGK